MRRQTNHTSIISRAFAALVLLLMFSLELLQAVHTHSCTGDLDHSEEAHFASTDVKCKVCDYLAQHRHEPIEAALSFEIHRPVTSLFKENQVLVIGIREFALEHWSNKGPPSLA